MQLSLPACVCKMAHMYSSSLQAVIPMLVLTIACSTMSGPMTLRAPLSETEQAKSGTERQSARYSRIATAMAAADFRLETVKTLLGQNANSILGSRGAMVDAQGYLRTLPDEVLVSGPASVYRWYMARATNDETVEFKVVLCRSDRSRENPTQVRGPLNPGINCERMSPDEEQTKAFLDAAARLQAALDNSEPASPKT